jgi:uncharacterized protein YjiS (DUF1127 family)
MLSLKNFHAASNGRFHVAPSGSGHPELGKSERDAMMTTVCTKSDNATRLGSLSRSSGLPRLWRRLWSWIQPNRTVRQLRDLNDGLLRHVGLTRPSLVSFNLPRSSHHI